MLFIPARRSRNDLTINHQVVAILTLLAAVTKQSLVVIKTHIRMAENRVMSTLKSLHHLSLCHITIERKANTISYLVGMIVYHLPRLRIIHIIIITVQIMSNINIISVALLKTLGKAIPNTITSHQGDLFVSHGLLLPT